MDDESKKVESEPVEDEQLEDVTGGFFEVPQAPGKDPIQGNLPYEQ